MNRSGTDTSDRDQRWWARGAFVFAVGAAAVPVLFAGVLGTVALLVVGIGGVVVTVAALYWFLIRRGVLRWISLAVAIIAPIIVLALFVRAHLLWVVLLSYVLALLAVVCARVALRSGRAEPMPEYPAPPPKHPFLIMNPHSGGGKVAKFDLKRKAEELGADVALLEGPATVDVTALAQRAVAQGADLLGVAGGDGTQALVAAVAAEHHLPFLVISAGTRNHFAMDLGLDRTDPTRSLDALRDGVELRVDLGTINGRPFVNNASFGVYAEIVRSPAYRDDKAATVLTLLPDLLTGHAGPRLLARIGETVVEGPQAVLVSNNPYGNSDLAGLNRRDRLDHGALGAVTVSVANTRQAIGLLRRTNVRGLTQQTALEVVVDADTPEIPVGVDGESLLLRTPVRCTVEPGALRVRVPRTRPGVRPAAPMFDWVRLWETASPPHIASASASRG
ncbi:diacylglycerol/lipid kinase family protein [Rhodococcus chondri]|uniref:Diacylglycerol kinase family protein n=1 Tax=Rhodococcus chondri TaxID=3065941 RepID=A0ABU7JWD3_9NOCA|nr:diacylglycerol kinase family protein [Rhodococcus sp. CC-R104]MEE2033839.1 diacylglycerol kinase family protein [Rhodococcus sp. CC-R104]